MEKRAFEAKTRLRNYCGEPKKVEVSYRRRGKTPTLPPAAAEREQEIQISPPASGKFELKSGEGQYPGTDRRCRCRVNIEIFVREARRFFTWPRLCWGQVIIISVGACPAEGNEAGSVLSVAKNPTFAHSSRFLPFLTLEASNWGIWSKSLNFNDALKRFNSSDRVIFPFTSLKCLQK